MRRRDRGPIARARRSAAGAAIAGIGLLAGCGLVVGARDAVEGRAIRQLAIGTWACAPAQPDDETDTFQVTVGDGTFRLRFDDPSAPTAPRGTWKVTDGDLAISFAGEADLGGPVLEVDRFDQLTPESQRFTLRLGEALAGQADDGDPTSTRVKVDADGTDAVTFTLPEGDPWTCRRQ